MHVASQNLHLSASEFSVLLDQLGPSLALWRAAEIAALRTQSYEPPVLDLGCGDGFVTSFVLRHVDIGVDPWPDAVRCAAARGLYARVETVPIERVRAAPASVATILSNSVLEHIRDIPTVLRACARLLRSGGRLIFTAPTEAFTDWLTFPAARYGAWRNRHYDHLNLWSIERWGQQLREAGFRILSVQPYLRRGFVTTWDTLELAQRVWIGPHRVFGVFWSRVPWPVLNSIAKRLAAVDLSAPSPGGGRLIVAQRS